MSRYRLVPTPAQQAVLRDHCAHARFVWNLAVEQHSCWRPGRPGAPGYLEQCRQLTAARAPAKPPKVLTGTQQAAIVGATRGVRDRFLVELLFSTGLRIGEACGMRRQDVHFLPDSAPLGCRFTGPHLHVVWREDNTNGALAKSPVARSVPVGLPLARLYADYQQERWRLLGESDSSSLVFVNLYRAPLGKGLRPDNVEELFERLSRKAGIKATPHTCRHTFATRLIRAGVDRDVVQALLGHASPISLAIYAHADWTDLRSAVDAMEHGRQAGAP